MIEKGKLLAGRYRLLEQVDSGGSAYIFRAKDEVSDSIVAIKILKPELMDNHEFVQRFKKEVQASLKLRHANIIRGYDAGLDNGMYYIVMELIEGQTLKQLVQKHGRMSVSEVVSLAKKLCLALEYAHVKGFVHRDIKPHNVMIDKDGEPYIADFGIAKNLEANTITIEDNSVMGSVHYFSPEQARGERADRRSDIYSLGIVMFEMLTGCVPFDGETSVNIALKHINEPMPDMKMEVVDLPESLNRIIMKATQKDKHFRYKSAFAMYEDLQRCLNEPDGGYIKYTESKRVQQHIEESNLRRSRKSVNKLWGAVGIAVLVVVALVVVFTLVIRNAARTVVVPDVMGMDQAKAYETLHSSGLTPKVVGRENSNDAEGTVIGQNPLTNASAYKNDDVELIVSKGLGAEYMPEVAGLSLEQAEETLKLSGIKYTVERIVEGEQAIGFVVEQQPEAGAQLTEDDVAILQVKVSPDARKVQVPAVVWNNIGTALETLDEAGFSRYLIYEDESDMGKGIVLEQMPAAETEYSVDEAIALHVSAFHDASYIYDDSVPVQVPEDQTTVTIAIQDIVDGHEVYYVVSETVEAAGEPTIIVSKKLRFDSKEDSITRNRVIFLNGVLKSVDGVVLEKGE